MERQKASRPDAARWGFSAHFAARQSRKMAQAKVLGRNSIFNRLKRFRLPAASAAAGHWRAPRLHPKRLALVENERMPIGVVAASLIRGRRFESNPGLLGIGHQQGLAVPGEIEALPVATVEAEVD